jgi:hypothetical protein
LGGKFSRRIIRFAGHCYKLFSTAELIPGLAGHPAFSEVKKKAPVSGPFSNGACSGSYPAREDRSLDVCTRNSERPSPIGDFAGCEALRSVAAGLSA